MKSYTERFKFLFLFIIVLGLFASCNGKKKESTSHEYHFGDPMKNNSDQMFIFRSNEELAEIDRLKALANLDPNWDESEYYIEGDDDDDDDDEDELEWYELEIENIEPLKANSAIFVDSLASAYSFLKDSLSFNGEFDYSYFPEYSMLYLYRRHDDADFARYGTKIIPLEERKMAPWIYDRASKGGIAFNQIWSYLLRERKSIDFYDIYTSNKRLIHTIISMEDYHKMKFEVDFLLMAYNDIQNDDELLFKIEDIMKIHERKITNPNFTGSTYEELIYPSLKEVIPKKSHDAVIGDDTGGILYEAARLVWYYSFWLRRAQEGNMENVYLTLEAINEDYSPM